MSVLPSILASFWSGAVAVVFILAAGWPVAAALGVRPRVPGAWIAGLVLLYAAGFLCQLFGLPVTLPIVGLVICVVAGIVWFAQRHDGRDEMPSPEALRLKLGTGPWVALSVVVLIFAARASSASRGR